jgi:uncharacterized protein (DUF1330 family)
MESCLEQGCAESSVRTIEQPQHRRQVSNSAANIFFGRSAQTIAIHDRAVFDTRFEAQPEPQENCVMNSNLKIVLAVVAGAALGAVAVQGLHAQAKPKAYLVTEIEIIDAAAQATYATAIQGAIKAAGARNFLTAGGKTTAFVGEAPKVVAISEWDSLEQVQAYRNSAAFKNLAPQRDKAQRQIRSYAVEAVN